jgi:putative nucleotidyltransferase with HDIG domain
MLKRISVQQLTLGMHLKDFCGSWMEHPFWRSAFVITDPDDLAAIRASSITEVWIDSAKGLDLAPDQPVVAVSDCDAQVDAQLASIASSKRQTRHVPSAVEFTRAVKIVSRSREAVTAMFEEARMGRAIDVTGTQRLVEEISDSVSRNPGALISIARLKTADNYTYMHSVAVCALMVALAKQLGLDEQQIRSAGVAGLLHDLGKARIPLAVLNKPGKLTDAEFRLIKSHPEEGHRMLLQGSGVDAIALDVVLHHHEKTDGSGYPNGLQGDDISLFAKMGAVCDVYDAITSDRPYKAGWCPAESLRRMTEWTTGHFEPRVFQAFVKSIGIYPIGTLLRINDGRLGVVIDKGEKSLLQPQLKLFYSTRAKAHILPQHHRPRARRVVPTRSSPSKIRRNGSFTHFSALWSGLPDPA